MSATAVGDSESLRNTFYDSKDQIEDGWTIIAEGVCERYEEETRYLNVVWVNPNGTEE